MVRLSLKGITKFKGDPKVHRLWNDCLQGTSVTSSAVTGSKCSYVSRHTREPSRAGALLGALKITPLQEFSPPRNPQVAPMAITASRAFFSSKAKVDFSLLVEELLLPFSPQQLKPTFSPQRQGRQLQFYSPLSLLILQLRWRQTLRGYTAPCSGQHKGSCSLGRFPFGTGAS